MSPISITPINYLNLHREYGTLSSYAQRFIKFQVKGLAFTLENFLAGINPKLLSEKEQKLKDIGIKQIGDNINEGVLITDNEYDYHVFSPDGKNLNFNIYKADNNEILQYFSLNNDSDKYLHSGSISGLNTEDEMSRIIDIVDNKVHLAKKEFLPLKIPKPFIPDETTSKKIAEINKTLRGKKKIIDIKNVGFIGTKEEELIEEINKKLLLSQEQYKKISDIRTKYEMRKSYKNYLPQSVANKLGFKNIGPNGESVSLFCTSYRNRAYTAISITNNNGKESRFVISQDNKSVQKNLPSKWVKSETSGYRIHITPQYYTQKEIDESNLHSYLSCLDKEMEQYIQHTQNLLNKKEERKLIKSNFDNATLDPYKDILNDIHSNFGKYQAKMRKYLRKPHKSRKFKTENNISVKLASTAVKFDKITPDGYDLRLSYPKVHDKTAMQLLVMRDDKIEKSFYIIDNKLLRFEIKDLNDKITHYNRNWYYYDNKYLEESNLNSYLLVLRDKLHELNEKLDIIRTKQLENRARYHIRSPKKQVDFVG